MEYIGESLNLQRAILLLGEGHTCAVCRENRTWFSDLHGIRPALYFSELRNEISGGSAADKIIGRAAAMLFVLSGVREVYAEVMTEDAAEILRSNGVRCCYSQLVPLIVNRTGDGPCPMEAAVAGINNPEQGRKSIREVLARLSTLNTKATK